MDISGRLVEAASAGFTSAGVLHQAKDVNNRHQA